MHSGWAEGVAALWPIRMPFLDQEQVEQDGFGICEAVVAPQQLAELSERLNTKFAGRSRAGVRHALSGPEVARLAGSPQLIDIARAILGGNATPFRATLFDKSPAANWLVVWHQDTALPLRERREVEGWGPWSKKAGIVYAHAPASALEKVIALRLHLDESTAENGPLRVLPGTHRSGVLTDEQIEEVAREVREQLCLVGRGGVVAMRPLIVHSSSKAKGQARRRVLHIEYAAVATLAGGLELVIA